MSVPGSTNMGSNEGDPGERLAPEDRAAIAAVDGLGSLSPFDAETVDATEVAQFEAAAGALFVAFNQARGTVEGPPPGLQRRLEQAADAYVSSRLSGQNDVAEAQERALGANDAGRMRRADGVHTFPEVASADRRPAPSGTAETGRTGVDSKSSRASRFHLLPALAGWAAAAALLIGLLTTAKRASDLEDGVASLQSPATRMAQLQMSASDAVELSWKPLGQGMRLRGSVIWSDERNEGYMKIDGLAVNDPSTSQYQLWIFRGTDPGAEPYPVDGGVFDISATGEVVVPISAKLSVGHAGTFAVTVEEPGGVVVSGREQIVALAQRA